MSHTILITGAHGQLGCELTRMLGSGRAEIGPIPQDYADAQVIAVDADALDITDAQAVSAFFAENAPDIVINCAAVTNVDGCEQNEEAAFAVNAIGAANVARAAQAVGAKLVHVSTDYVFAGNEPGERVETDEVAPKSAYGRTKLAGERAVEEAIEEHFIVRTAWLYGYIGKNFVKTMRRLGRAHDRVSVVDDQIGNPTNANDLAYEILMIALTDDYGTYHITNNGICSWAEFATAIMKGSGLDCVVSPVTSEQYKEMNPASADRPRFSALRNAHLAEAVGDEMRDWRAALDMYLDNIDELGDEN